MPADKNIGLGIKFEASFGNLDAVLREMQTKINDLNSKLKSLTDTGSKNADKLGSSYNGVLDKIKRISESVKQAEGSFQKSLKSTQDAFNLEQYLTKKSKETYKDLYQSREAAITKLEKIQSYVSKRVADGTMDEVTAANRITNAQTKVAEATANVGKALDTLKFKKDTPKVIASGFEEATKQIKTASTAVRRAYDTYAEGYNQVYESIKATALAEKSAKDASIKSAKEQIIANKELIADKTKTLAQNREIASEYLKSLGVQNKAIKEAGILEQTTKEGTMKAARELAATQLATSKIVATSLKEETKVRQDNTKEIVTQSKITEQTREVAKKATESFGTLAGALRDEVQSAKIHNAVMPDLVKNLNKAAGETDAYKTALIQLGKESGSSAIRFQDLASNLKAVEKGLQATGKAGAEVRKQFGYDGIPKDFANTVTAAERVAMTYDRVNGALSKTNGVLTSTKQGYYQLNNDLKNIKTTYGEVAWATAEVDKRLGSEIRTLGDLERELKSTQGSLKSQSVVWNEAGKAIDYAAARMNESNKVTKEGVKVGDAWKASASQQAVATSFLKGEIANVNGTFLQFGKTSLQTSSQIEKLNIQANKLGEQGKALSESFGTAGGVKSLNSYGNAIKDLSTYQNNLAKSTNELAKFQEKATKSYGASQEVVDAYSSRIEKGTMTIGRANSELREQKRVMDDSKNAITNLGNNLEFLNQHFKDLLTSDTNYGAQARKTLAVMEENSKTVKGSAQAYRMTKDALQQLDAQLKYAEAGLTNYHEAIKKVGSSNEQIAGKIKELNQQIANGSITHKEAAVQLKEFSKGIDTIGTSSKNIGNFWAGFVNKIQGGGQAAQVAAGYFTNLGRSVATLGAWMPAAVIIGGVMEAIYGAITAVTDFDQSLKSLQAISGGTNAEISLLGKEILKISTETKYSAKQIADGAIFIAQAGFSAQESLQVIGAAARGAQGTLESLSIASDLLTSVIRAFHRPASEAAQIMDMLSVAANASKTNLEGMKIVFNYLGPAAYAAFGGMKTAINETLGAVMALSNAGMRMSTVGTSLRQLFIILEKPTGALNKMLKAQGMSMEDISLKSNGLIPALTNLAKVIQGDLGNAVSATNVRTASAALLLTSMKDHVADMIKYTTEWGASARMADKQSESLAISWTKLINKINAMVVSFSQGGITGIFSNLIAGASKLVDGLDYLINNSFVQFAAVAGTTYLALDSLYLALMSIYTLIKVKMVGAFESGASVLTKYLSALDLTSAASGNWVSSLRGLEFSANIATGSINGLTAAEIALAEAQTAEMAASVKLTDATTAVKVAKEAQVTADWELTQASAAYTAAVSSESAAASAVKSAKVELVALQEAEIAAKAKAVLASQALTEAELSLGIATAAHEKVMQREIAGSPAYIASEERLALAKKAHAKAIEEASLANAVYTKSTDAVVVAESKVTTATISHDLASKKLTASIISNEAAEAAQKITKEKVVLATGAEIVANEALVLSNVKTKEATVALTVAQEYAKITTEGFSFATWALSAAQGAATIATNIFTAAINKLKVAIVFLLANPIVALIAGLSLVAARVYMSQKGMEEYSIAIQENTMRYSANRDEALSFAKSLGELRDRTGSAESKLGDYSVILGQITKKFPELSASMAVTRNDFNAQIALLEKLSAVQNSKTNDSAKQSIKDLGEQYHQNTIKLSAYTKMIEENNSMQFHAVKWLINAIGYYSQFAKIFKDDAYTLQLRTQKEIEWTAAFKDSDAAVRKAAADAKFSVLGDQLRIYSEALTMVMSLEKGARKSFLDTLPVGEYRNKLQEMVKTRQDELEHLIKQLDKQEEAEFDMMTILGKGWEDYYLDQTTSGRTYVAEMAKQAIKAGEAAKKAIKDAKGDSAAQNEAERKAYEDSLNKMKDSRIKYSMDILKVMDKETEEKIKSIKKSSESEQKYLEVVHNKELAELRSRFTDEHTYITKKQDLEEDYYKKNLTNLQDAYTKEKELIDKNYNDKKEHIEKMRKVTGEEGANAALLAADRKYADELKSLYLQMEGSYKTFIDNRIAKLNEYTAAYKKSKDEIIAAEKDLEKELQSLDKTRRSINEMTMTDEEKLASRQQAFNNLLIKGYEKLSDAQKASSKEARDASIADAKSYFDEANGMINSLTAAKKKEKDKEIDDIESTKRIQLAAADEIEKAFKAKETAIKETSQRFGDEAQAGISEVTEELKVLMEEMKKFKDLETEQVKISLNLNKFDEDIKLLKGKLGEDRELVIAIKGSGSETLPISEKIVEIKGMMDEFKKYLSNPDSAPQIIMNFVASTIVGVYEPISTSIDNVKVLLNKLSTDLTASVTNFLIQIVGKDGGDQGFINVVETRVRNLLNKLSTDLTASVTDFLIQIKGNDGSGSDWINTIISNVTSKFATLTETLSKGATYTITTKYVTEGTPPSGGSSGSGSGGASGNSSSHDFWNAPLGEYSIFAEGGGVPGEGDSDSVPAMLTPGEFVVRKQAVGALGEGFFHVINSMKSFAMPKFNMQGIQAFAGGGVVKSIDHGSFTLNLTAGNTKLPLTVVGNPNTMRMQIKKFEKELSRMKLSRA